MHDHVVDQLAQHARQRRPLHDAQVDVAVELERPIELAVRGIEPLRHVGLPFGAGVRQQVRRRRQPARQRLQVLQRVADVVLHLRALRLVHQRQQARADVVVQVLRDAGTLLVAPLLDRAVECDRAHHLLEHAVGQARVLA